MFFSPLVYRGVVYIGSDDGYLYAINAEDGTLKWKYKTEGAIGSATPAIFTGLGDCKGCDQHDVVYVTSDDSRLYAVKLQDGTMKWRYSTKHHVWSSPVIQNDAVYFSSTDFNLYAVKA